jgi:hypothetical protein
VCIYCWHKLSNPVDSYTTQKGEEENWIWGTLSFSYRSSSIRVTISITNRCDFCFMSLFHISLPALHVSGFYRPIIWGISCFMLPFGSCSICWPSLCACELVFGGGFTVKPPPQTSSQGTQTVNKHCMNQMVTYKQQLKIPPMMGLWRPETCRVGREIWNKDIKQKSQLLVILILTWIWGLGWKIYYVRKDNIKVDFEPHNKSVWNALIWVGIKIRIAEFFRLWEKFWSIEQQLACQ